MRQVFFGPQLQLGVRPESMGRPVVNTISDPDTSKQALAQLADLVARMRAPCFNAPAAVLDSSRERVAAKLAGIPGLHVPRTVRVRLDEPAALEALAAEHGLAFPLIVRPAGTHGGDATARVDHPADAATALRAIPWGGHDLFLTQFVDYRDDDGMYRKSRVVFVGDEVFLRHQVAADGWHVHVRDRSEDSLREEDAALRAVPQARARLRPLLAAVADAIALDFFGMDCSLRPDGSVLLFEANAAMNVLHNLRPSPNQWDEPIRQVTDALVGLLADPTRWRHGASPAA
jgi:glutathione synthase/RimK-type ligase-like ATP-grasp enzyme